MVSNMESKKPKRIRRNFTDEFKAGAVRLVLEEHKQVAEVARDLDLTQSSLGAWVKQARADRSKGKTGLTTAEREELSRLRRENRELRMERAILKKAAVRSSRHCNTMPPGIWLKGTVEHAETEKRIVWR
jgi:transposase